VSPEVTAERAALEKFELGRFLLANLGLNGHWTSYVLMHPDRGRKTEVSSDGTALTELIDGFWIDVQSYLQLKRGSRSFEK
jgi:hypothetical protein